MTKATIREDTTIVVDNERFYIESVGNGIVVYRAQGREGTFTEPVENFKEHLENATYWDVKDGKPVIEQWWEHDYQGGRIA